MSMSTPQSIDDAVWTDLSQGTPTFWLNDKVGRAVGADVPALGLEDVHAAAARWQRFAPALAARFGDAVPDGIIESPLLKIPNVTSKWLSRSAPPSARILLKADHALPIAGSVKARGGIYEVLCVAERIALAKGLLASTQDDYRKLLEPRGADLFARYRLLVASTGNLGYAVGTAARAFGFETVVHMSRDAKEWKKARLRALGAQVIEHAADYTRAVAAAREDAAGSADAHFVDDEQSVDLFLGYSVAAVRLLAQLRQQQIEVSDEQPLCVYLPCGVGGAPGGVLFGLKALLGDAVLGFFAEPTASACMLMRLMQRLPASASVYDIGLDNRTEADGLAVASASELVASVVGDSVTGAYTVSDAEMLQWVGRCHELEGLRLEPSATAGFPGAFRHVWESPQLESRRGVLSAATHVIWTTGGSMVPQSEFDALLTRVPR
jgi:D-serine dehydratase